MSLNSELLDILVCPESKKPLIYFEDDDFLFCPDSRLKYPIKDGIPQMLVEEAEEVSQEESERLQQEAEEKSLTITAGETTSN